MATLRLTIPDDDVSRLVAALLDDNPPPSGVTQLQWARETLKRLLQRRVWVYEKKLAAQQNVVVPPDMTVTSE